MPELPEVENIAQGLREVIEHHRITEVRVYTPVIIKGPQGKQWRRFITGLTGQRLTHIIRRGKRLLMTTSQGDTLVFQLGMTGKFLLQNVKGAASRRYIHTHLVMRFSQGIKAHFVDTRRFGRVWLLQDLDPDHPDPTMEEAGLGPLGPEALSINIKAFKEILKNQRPIKSLLLDQSRIAGLGNIYVDESLFAACIHPARRCSTLTPLEANTLLYHLKRVLKRSIRAGGTTFSDYCNAYGDMGRFRDRLQVYQRHGHPCKRCGSVIERLIVTGRGTHICPHCQQ